MERTDHVCQDGLDSPVFSALTMPSADLSSENIAHVLYEGDTAGWIVWAGL